uniref:Predicted helicase n=1 Tax=Candidatus Kentrum eta TaxID=2126337 RepID=A0A450V1W1_9GAMM|nr:MAG: Predicted helicase [Candidatus Kentron sp. H]VFJ91929.1 MAG: Predicted helicase [Candidatus Kentron sp. H]VFJ98772.1 MAG: Predicted helicase [Candidatus Kentron sp. H]
MPTPLENLIAHYRRQSQTEREKGAYFEELIRAYFRHEPTYADLYEEVWLYGDWARQQGFDARDVGVDLVAKTRTGAQTSAKTSAKTDEYHAIQCKFHAPDHKVTKSDIDSFFTASGQAPFTRRIIVSTTIHWTEHADDALRGQTPPVTKIDLQDLENSQIDWSRYQPSAPVSLKPKKTLRPHQTQALENVTTGLRHTDRGKLIMACGTGKTLASLKIAETLAGADKRVLLLAPSLALLSQILTEWTQESRIPLHSFAVCSDSEVGKKRPRNSPTNTNRDDDKVETFAHELRYPATTDADRLADEMIRRHDPDHMSVVFSTYHSIGVLHKAQRDHDLPAFDLIICDEAHRTTGATFAGDDESNFVRIHDADYIQGAKRLYMTATPRIYGDIAQVSAERDEVTLASMDDSALYGQDLHTLTFSEAVNRGLLVDYKVIILTMDEAHVSRRLQNLLKDENNSLKVDDAAKIVGCWKALCKHQTEEAEQTPDPDPMRRAVAFCQVIEPAIGKRKTHKVSSRQIAGMFQEVVRAYREHQDEYGTLQCQAEHVDGGMNASQKEEKLGWLRAQPPDNTCRILSNVRCLSEGVDVPALDAVLFLTPRNSQVDVVQSVGRVMRNAPGKTRGYVILPVVIPAGMKLHEALADNRTYKVVWEVLQALRSHDDRFEAMINKLDLTGAPPAKMEVIAIDDRTIRKANRHRKTLAERLAAQARGGQGIGNAPVGPSPDTGTQTEIEFEPGEVERAIYAKIVEKCGRRTYWEDWAGDIARIARTHITRIETILENPANKEERRAFREFVKELRDDLNPAITKAEVIEMLAQHLITQPVFEALFEGHGDGGRPGSGEEDLQSLHDDRQSTGSNGFPTGSNDFSTGSNCFAMESNDSATGGNSFLTVSNGLATERNGFPTGGHGSASRNSFAANNPVSRGMRKILSLLNGHYLEKEADTLRGFYASVRMRAEGIDNAAGKQKIINELYDKFFRNAFPRMTERLGIVYTPVEIVDFILHSIDQLLRAEFGENLGSQGVHIIDPFVGTGTFLTRLLQSGLIGPEELPHKYHNEIHANEIMLLAYYIAAINIEVAYHDRMGDQGDGYQPFPGICLTDTFQLHEQDDQIQDKLKENSRRRMHQKGLKEIRVIMSNPPYSAGQGSANDNNRNVPYPILDERIRTTYAERSVMTSVRQLYDSYIRAIRWASDRIGESGVIGFVTNAGFLEANLADGLRQCLAEEFSSLYLLHLRGNQRTQGELSRREGGKIFGSASRAPVAISLLVKNPDATEKGRIRLHDIGDYLTREEKLERIAGFESVDGITKANGWREITPDRHGDWLAQRDDGFGEFIVMGDKKGDEEKLFDNFSLGIASGRDAWCYNPGKTAVGDNMQRMIAFYNGEVARFNQAHGDLSTKERQAKVDGFINTDPAEISWSHNVKQELAKDRRLSFEPNSSIPSLYRPFSKQWLYYNRRFNERVYQMPRIFPHAVAENLVICVSGVGARSFSTLISDHLPCLDNIEKGQCFPLYLYDQDGSNRRDAITDQGLTHFRAAYPFDAITKEDLFYYIYGLLHSPDYRSRYANNLSKELPRIPAVKTIAGFRAFSEAGRELARLHLDYEAVEMYPATLESGASEPEHYRVEKMRYGKRRENGKTVKDLTTIVYNHRITVRDIPPEAYDYVVNGKPAMDWVMERQRVKTDKASGITVDANHWAMETMHNPKYPLELLLRVITVSLETMKIVDNLPGLDIIGKATHT